jgi:type VI secretion system protein ImpC
MLKIRVLNVSKPDLLRDLERAVEFDQSALFKKVQEEVYGEFGGTPFGVLIGDYEIGRHSQDIALLERISNIAAAAHAPFIAAASPELFNMDNFAELSMTRDLANIFDSMEYVKWKSFRDSADSRYVGLTVPRILMRLPYTPRPVPVETFQFSEDVDANGRLFLWGKAAYAFAACLTTAFVKYHWCAAIRGVEGGGLVTGLPTWTFKTDEGGWLTSAQLKLLSQIGAKKNWPISASFPWCPAWEPTLPHFFPPHHVSNPESMIPTWRM